MSSFNTIETLEDFKGTQNHSSIVKLAKYFEFITCVHNEFPCVSLHKFLPTRAFAKGKTYFSSHPPKSLGKAMEDHLLSGFRLITCFLPKDNGSSSYESFSAPPCEWLHWSSSISLYSPRPPWAGLVLPLWITIYSPRLKFRFPLF